MRRCCLQLDIEQLTSHGAGERAEILLHPLGPPRFALSQLVEQCGDGRKRRLQSHALGARAGVAAGVEALSECLVECLLPEELRGVVGGRRRRRRGCDRYAAERHALELELVGAPANDADRVMPRRA